MTKDEFVRRADDAIYMNNLSLLQGDVDALFGELDRLRARASEDADRLHKAVAEVERLRAERDEARDAYQFRGGYVEDASGDRWWSAGLLSKVDQERDVARAEVERLRALLPPSAHTGEHGTSRSVADAHATWAAVMRQLDEVSSRARRACQVLVAEIGADGPADVDTAAERAAVEIRDLRDQVDDLRAAQEESEHQMHLRIRSGYDKTIADSWRAKVAEVEAERDAALADADRRLNAYDAMRAALRHLLLSRDASWTGGHDWTEAVDDAVRALGIEESK